MLAYGKNIPGNNQFSDFGQKNIILLRKQFAHIFEKFTQIVYILHALFPKSKSLHTKFIKSLVKHKYLVVDQAHVIYNTCLFR